MRNGLRTVHNRLFTETSLGMSIKYTQGVGDGKTWLPPPRYILKTRWPPVTIGARSRQSYGRIGNCEQSKKSFGSRSSSVDICIGIRSGTCAVKPHFTDTRLIQTPRYYGQFVLSLGRDSSYIFSKFNPLNTDTSLIRTLSMTPSVSVLTGFDCTGSI